MTNSIALGDVLMDLEASQHVFLPKSVIYVILDKYAKNFN